MTPIDLTRAAFRAWWIAAQFQTRMMAGMWK